MNSKMGRNPFAASEKQLENFKPSDIPKKVLRKKETNGFLSTKKQERKSGSKKIKSPVLERFYLPWRGYALEQASLFRFRKEMGQWRLELLNLGIHSKKSSDRRVLEWNLVNRGPLKVAAFSVVFR